MITSPKQATQRAMDQYTIHNTSDHHPARPYACQCGSCSYFRKIAPAVAARIDGELYRQVREALYKSLQQGYPLTS